jgi:hypothetical protein
MLRALIITLTLSRYQFVWPRFMQSTEAVCEASNDTPASRRGIKAEGCLSFQLGRCFDSRSFTERACSRSFIDGQKACATPPHPQQPRARRSKRLSSRCRHLARDQSRIGCDGDMASILSESGKVRGRRKRIDHGGAAPVVLAKIEQHVPKGVASGPRRRERARMPPVRPEAASALHQ